MNGPQVHAEEILPQQRKKLTPCAWASASMSARSTMLTPNARQKTVRGVRHRSMEAARPGAFHSTGRMK
jgi:hypothetical protein